MNAGLETLGAEGLRRFDALRTEAADAVTERLYATYGPIYEQYGPHGRKTCREDIALHLEFLRPALEFGVAPPMVDYLCWYASVIAARGIPREHVALSLEWLAAFYAERMQPAEAAVVTAALRAARRDFLNAETAPAAAPRAPDPWPEAAVFLSSLLAGDHREALAIMQRCADGGRSLSEIELHVVQPALYQIGEKWQANQVTVAREHMATAIAQSVMTAGLLRSTPVAPNGKRALLACVEGNDHALGLRMVADAFQLGGWDVRYLGANVPGPALVLQAQEWAPDLVGLSIAFPPQLRAAKDVIAALNEPPRRARPAVIVGGLAINRFSRLVDLVGADADGHDAGSALAHANRLVGA